MGRAKGNGKKKKKKTIISSHYDSGSGKEEKVPPLKQRGRPQKPPKDETKEVEDQNEKMEEDLKIPIDGDNEVAEENGRKRKRSVNQAKENLDTVKENCSGSKSSTDDSTKPVGFRQIGSRRKNKPRRAAEAVIECR